MEDTRSEIANLKQLISKIELTGGTRLPAEPQLAQELNITRGRLRTLLKKVEQEGLIWRHVGKGTFITPTNSPDNLPIIEDISIAEVMDARLAFEPGMAIQAALFAKSSDLKTMQSAIQSMETSANYSEWKRFDFEFHRAIALASHNALILALYDMLSKQIANTIGVRLNNIYQHDMPSLRVNDQHQRIYDAIASHDPEMASKIMREHLIAVRTSLFDMLDV
ncbi:FadR/GntR family transcriptional regulator [Marinomonas shanghaiensis]|uniref:FadR/GntR family transcriptional regulator n=1 Tax=Marinomonas shanghaiensis TaxID=2202418 RepID=UPI003A90BD2E